MTDMRIEVNCSPGVDEDGNPLPIKQVEVPLTAAEKAQRVKDQADAEARHAAAEQAAADRRAKVDAIRNAAGIPPAVRAAIADLFDRQ